MVTQLSDLFDVEDLRAACDAGYVRWQRHPELPLLIYNYTARAAYEGVWTPVTSQCRGLIATEQGEVVARPWPKFFNHGDPAATLDLEAPVEVTDKIDGSLGILYPTSISRYAIATRGSFTSDQAIHATQVLRSRYNDFVPPDGTTVLVEIVYPENRIVLDYEDTDDLILLGAVHNDSGYPHGPGVIRDMAGGWTGPCTATFPARTLADALAVQPRENAEGVVVRCHETGRMVKIKQADYVELHRLITGLNERVVWDRLGQGEKPADICAAIPDEFHRWVNAVAQGLHGALDAYAEETAEAHEKILATLPGGWTRRDYAERAKQTSYAPWLFLLLDGKDPRERIWQSLKPSGQERPFSISEDVA